MGTTRQKALVAIACKTAHVRFHERKWVHTRLSEKDRTQRHTRRKRGAFRMGPQSLPSTRTARSRTSPGRVSERQTLPLWDLGREVLSKNAESLRDSDALMRVAVPQASRPRWAALLCLQFGDVAVFSLCAQGFPHMQKRVWYHYPRRAPRVVETLGGRLSKGLICHFSRSGGLH